MQRKSLFPLFMLLMMGIAAGSPLMSARADDSLSLPPQATTPITDEILSQAENPYFNIETLTLPDGRELEKQIINGPPRPPEAYLARRTVVTSLNRGATLLPDFPSYSWVFGCSAVSGAMIAGYYDRTGYPNMYTGPTNGGLMPLTDTSWPQWYSSVPDAYDPYPGNPLVASKSGLDGRTTRGSIDDYWLSYFSYDDDPYISNNWTDHTWGTAIGDFMKTSQSAFGNVDGGTTFYTWPDGSKLNCSTMTTTPADKKYPISYYDGTYGRKLFYEARGYLVQDCYNQPTDDKNSDYFSLADFQSEINAGNPVLLNLRGHSVVGFGYEGSTIYIRDTWDSDPSHTYSMPWDGCLPTDDNGCLELLSVSVVTLRSIPISPPVEFEKMQPEDSTSDLDVSGVKLNWQPSSNAIRYEVCYKKTDDPACTDWVDNGTSTSKDLPELEAGTIYAWQVRAYNEGGYTYADGSWDAFWQFSTYIDPPGEFNKLKPEDMAADLVPPVSLSWSPSANASYYEVCYAASEADCTNWEFAGTNTSFVPSTLNGKTTYDWQVRAVNIEDTTYADGGAAEYWSFTTGAVGQIFLPVIFGD